MTPENLPDLYARVVAKRPELAVKWHIDERFVLAHRNDRHFIWWSYRRDDGFECNRTVDDATAAALILAKWVEALPIHAGVVRGMDQDNHSRWYVDGPRHIYDCCDTPLEALASFYLEYQP